MTTEHFTLQSARSATITESLGRSTIYLGSLSASLVALALIAQGTGTVDLRLAALVILPALVFLGTVTFVRILETGIEDSICAQAIARIRHYYLELAGEDARYFLLGGRDDLEGALANMGITGSRWRPFFSVASVIALINSMVTAYVSVKHALACRSLGIRHLRTRPYRPQTNGKAERFIRTLLQGWAYGAIYGSSKERTAALDGWSGTTTIAGDTQRSATNPRSAGPTCSALTPRRRSARWRAPGFRRAGLLRISPL